MIRTRRSSTLSRKFYQLGYSAGLASSVTDPYPSARELASEVGAIVWSSYLNGYRAGQHARQGVPT